MRDDLLEAQAAVDWAMAQFPSLRERINAWAKLNFEVIIEDADVSIPNNVIFALQKEPLPIAFNVEFGAYLNTIRTSLDILATALARRYDIGKPDQTYFPIANSEAEFAMGNFKGAKFVKGLPQPQQAFIKNLKPYRGGNDVLWTLHQLDIMRKHRRLLTVRMEAYSLSVIGADSGQIYHSDS